MLLRFPEQKVSIGIVCNLASMNPDDLAGAVADIFLGEELGPVDSTEQEEEKKTKSQVSFQWKNPDFLLKNPDFLLKNVDFRINLRRAQMQIKQPRLQLT